MGEQTDPTTSTSAEATASLQRSLAVVVGGVQQMKVAVQSGQLVIDPATGRRLQRAIADHIEQVTQWRQRADDLSGPLPLGQNWVGAGMSAKFAGRASGTDDSLATVLGQYHGVLTEAHDAIVQSMANYTSTDDSIGSQLKRLDHSSKGARLS
jgi:hypothetical protein